MGLDLSKVTLIVSEIDGIVTNHISPITETGITLYKYYCMKDFEAINKIKKSFDFAFLSCDNSINYNLCAVKNIPFFWAKDSVNKKEKMIVNIMQRYSSTPDNTIYVGSSYTDEGCFTMIPTSFCPSDSVLQIKDKSAVMLDSLGGCGVLCELYDRWLLPEITSRIRVA